MDGYAGRIYAINPQYDSVEGVSCFASLGICGYGGA